MTADEEKELRGRAARAEENLRHSSYQAQVDHVRRLQAKLAIARGALEKIVEFDEYCSEGVARAAIAQLDRKEGG